MATVKPTSTSRRKVCCYLARTRRLLYLSILLLGILLVLVNVRTALHNKKNDRSPHRLAGGTVQPTSTMNVKTQQVPHHNTSCKFRVRSVRDLQQCYPKHQVRPLSSPDCNSITEWKHVQRCLNGRMNHHNVNASTITPPYHFDISLIGERNSGTKFLTLELQRCFRSLSSILNSNHNVTSSVPTRRLTATLPTVKIHRDFLRHKHFFQPVNDHVAMIAAADARQRIVIALFRDPVEWVAAMREAPYHSPHHVAGYGASSSSSSSSSSESNKVIPLAWQQFVERPWTTDRTAQDLEILRNESAIQETFQGKTCLYRYSILDVVPCIFDNETKSYPLIPDERLRGFVPVYELRRDGSQRPFDHVLQLRAEKIVNFLIEVPLLLYYQNLGGYVAVRYEDVVTQGTRPLLEQVARLMGLTHLPTDCVPTGPQPERLGRRFIPDDFRQWILDHMDPDLERLLGYPH